MKKLIALALILALAVSLCGCFPFNLINKAESAASGLESMIESQADKLESDIESKADSIGGLAENIGSSIENSFGSSSDDLEKEISDLIADTQIIGNSDYGYMRVPKDFVQFKDSAGGDDLQYSDKAGSTIFTLNKISADIPAYTAMSSIEEKVKSEGATDVTTSSDAELNGFVGDEISCYYPSEKKYLTIYLIPFTERTAYIAVEYTKENEYMTAYTQSWSPNEIVD